MKSFLISLLIALSSGGLCYLILTNWLSAVIVSSLFLFVSYILTFPLLEERKRFERISHERYRFINSFLISYSVSPSSEDAFTAATAEMNGELESITKELSDKPAEEKLAYLEGYFSSNSYKMFLALFELIKEQGGDVLKMSTCLLSRLTQEEEELASNKRIIQKTVTEFSILWLLSVFILVFIKFCISNFYEFLLGNTIYVVGVVCYFALLAFSYYGLAAAINGKLFPKKREGII